MQFLYPQLWWLALLALIPIVLYLFRRRSKTVDVSSLVFFKSLAREHQESEWLRRLKRLISLLLTLFLLLAAVSALARVVFSPVSDATRNVVILLDRSASMAATDNAGKTRLQAAKEAIRNRLEGLNHSIGVSLIAYDTRPEILQPRTLKRRALLSALGEIQVHPVSHDLDAALETARTLARLETPAEIWHVSDIAAEIDLPAEMRLVPVPVDLAESVNVGFTAFQIRKVPLQSSRFAAFLQVSCNQSAPETVTGSIEVRVGGVFLSPRHFELDPGESAGFEVPIDGAEEQLLQLSLRVEGDCLPLDDSILVPLPESRPIVAARIGPGDAADPFTHLALQSLVKDGELQVWSASPDRWPLEDIDVAIFDNWLPDEWPADVPVIAIDPPGALGPIQAVPLQSGGIPHRDIRVANSDHPVVFRVTGSRLALTQTCVFSGAGSFEPLWLAGNEPVLAAGSVGGQRIVLMGFAPKSSERLPLTASFPLLMGNAIYWCAEANSTAGGNLQRRKTGEVIAVSGNQTTWTELRGGDLVTTSRPLSQSLLDLNRSGVWETNGGQRGTSHLLSIQETNIQPATEAKSAPVATLAQKPGFGLGNITWIILGLILAVLIVESTLFHWFAVY